MKLSCFEGNGNKFGVVRKCVVHRNNNCINNNYTIYFITGVGKKILHMNMMPLCAGLSPPV